MAIIKPNNNTISAITALPAGVGGKVLQVVQVAKTDTYGETISGNTLSTTIVTGLQPSITPASTSNKILVMVTLSVGYASNSTGDSLGFVIKRDSTAIGKGDSSGSRTSLTTASNFSSTFQLEDLSMTFLDSPSSTSSLTYGISLFNGSGSSRTCLLNRDDRNDDAAYAARGMSSITLMEIAG
jgi:hypothetical protein